MCHCTTLLHLQEMAARVQDSELELGMERLRRGQQEGFQAVVEAIPKVGARTRNPEALSLEPWNPKP